MVVDALLETSDLDVFYGNVVGLRKASIHVAAGELVAILGGNGAGKSSLLKGICRLARASGSVRFDGHELLRRPQHDLIRLGVAIVPEGRQVFPSLTVQENLYVGAGMLKRAERRKAVARMLEMFPILGRRRKQLAGTMSGGEQQILAIARAVVTDPRLCVMDEPSLGLAPVMVESVFAEIRRLSELGMTLLVVEQLASVVLEVADRGYVLEHGHVRLHGSAAELTGNPEVQRRYLGVSKA